MKQPPRKRAKVGSAENTHAEMNAVIPSPPDHVNMTPDDMPFWESVVAEFARDEWTTHQLEVAAYLACAGADYNKEKESLRREGFVVKNAKGFDFVNPRNKVVESLAALILSLRRSLSLNVRAKQGETRDLARRRKSAQEARTTATELQSEDEGLIPTLPH